MKKNKLSFVFWRLVFYQLPIINQIKMNFLIKSVECLFNILKNDLFTGVMKYSVSAESLWMILSLKRK